MRTLFVLHASNRNLIDLEVIAEYDDIPIPPIDAAILGRYGVNYIVLAVYFDIPKDVIYVRCRPAKNPHKVYTSG